MNGIAAVMIALMLLSTPAAAIGFQQGTAPDPDDQPLEIGIWYPSDAPASPQRLGLFEQSVAPNGAIAGARLPLIVFSHGTGGSFEGHYDTALALAGAGFVVVAATHTGDNYRDHSKFGDFASRSRHIARALDYMLSAWPGHDHIDAARIGMFGFSAGGATTLVTIGGTPDLSLVRGFCAAHPEDWGCLEAEKRHLDRAAAAPPGSAWVHDARVKAAVIAAPAIGYAFTREGLAGITVPIQLWRGDKDEILPHPYHTEAVSQALPTKPDYHVVPNAGHFAFLALCSAGLAGVAPDICRDPPGFDRIAFHRDFDAAVVAFFTAHLSPR
ncbi:MAG: alpha/beta hydrolase family protein [Stellaceae bacterium]